jgi:hypothetical protein
VVVPSVLELLRHCVGYKMGQLTGKMNGNNLDDIIANYEIMYP